MSLFPKVWDFLVKTKWGRGIRTLYLGYLRVVPGGEYSRLCMIYKSRFDKGAVVLCTGWRGRTPFGLGGAFLFGGSFVKGLEMGNPKKLWLFAMPV